MWRVKVDITTEQRLEVDGWRVALLAAKQKLKESRREFDISDISYFQAIEALPSLLFKVFKSVRIIFLTHTFIFLEYITVSVFGRLVCGFVVIVFDYNNFKSQLAFRLHSI